MKKLTLSLILGIIFSGNLLGETPDILWTKTYGGANREMGNSVYQTTDDGYIIAGITESFGSGAEDIYLIKTDSNGDTLWTKTYGGLEQDWAYAVQQTTDEGFIVVGFTSSFDDKDIYLLKTDSNGEEVWTKTYGGTEGDRGQSVYQTTDDGYIIAGITESFGSGAEDIYLLKTDSNGDTLWTKTYGGLEQDWAYAVQQTTDEGFIVVGYTFSFGSNGDVYLIKTDSNGDTLWTKTYGGLDFDLGISVKQTSDNGYILSGTKFMVSTENGYDFYLIKTDSNGDTLWTKTYGGTKAEIGFSVQNTTDGGYIVAGTKGYSLDDGFDAVASNDIYILKTNSQGDTLWTKTLGGSNHDAVGESSSIMQQTSDNGYIIVGSTISFLTENINVWIVKISPDFSIVSVKNDSNLSSFKLFNNSPNPFNPTTTITYTLPEGRSAHVRLNVYDISGALVCTLVNETCRPGVHSVIWDGTDETGNMVASGVYIYQLKAGDFITSNRMLLVR